MEMAIQHKRRTTRTELEFSDAGFIFHLKKVKVAHTRLPSVGFRSWSRFLAVSLQVMWVINPAVGYHYFPPGLQLPPQPLRGLLPISLLGEQRRNECKTKTVRTRQRRSCDLNPGPTAPESSTLTTRLPSHLRLKIFMDLSKWGGAIAPWVRHWLVLPDRSVSTSLDWSFL